MQAVQREQNASFLQRLVVLHHCRDGLGVRHLARLRFLITLGDHQHHESHSNFPPCDVTYRLAASVAGTSWSCRTSVSPSPAMFRNCLVISMASFLEAALMI